MSNIDAIENAIDFLIDLQGVSEWRKNSTPSNNRYMVELAETIKALEQFKAEQKPAEDELWVEVVHAASKMADNPSFDYGVPFWAIADFLDNIRKEYSIIKK